MSASCPTKSSMSWPRPRPSAPPGWGASTGISPACATPWRRSWRVAPGGFTVTDFAVKVQAMTGQSEYAYTIRQAAYDLRKLRGKHLVDKPSRSRRYVVPEHAARTIVGLVVLRDQVVVPILGGLRTD